MLITDQVAIAPCTDCVQVRRPPLSKAGRAFNVFPRITRVIVLSSSGTASEELFQPIQILVSVHTPSIRSSIVTMAQSRTGEFATSLFPLFASMVARFPPPPFQ